MRMRLVALLALALGCQSYETRRQEHVKLMQSARQQSAPMLEVARQPTPPPALPTYRAPDQSAPAPAPAASPLASPPVASPLASPAPVGPPLAPAASPLAAASPLVSANTPPVPAAPAVEQAEPATVAPADKLAQLYQRAAQRYAGMDSYIARLRRTEEVGGKLQPEEVALFKFRKEPWSVYLKWLGPEGKGREATYVKGRYEDKLHTLLAVGDVPLMPAGKVMSLDPHGYLVRSNSRHPITEAGIGALLDRYGTLVREYPTTISYQGSTRKPEFAHPLDEVLQAVPPGLDAQLPRGGSRRWFFDTQSGLPVMILTWNDSKQLVESYAYEQIMFPVKLDDHDFDPAVLWKKKD